MTIKLVCHINDDSDLLEAWLRYYRDLGVASFHFIVHGPRSENARLFELRDSFPIHIEDEYEGDYQSETKRERTNSVIARMRGEWLLQVDSDEFVEFPYGSIFTTIRILKIFGANTLYAPMIQRMTADGSLNTGEIILNPFEEFPLWSVDLYERMGCPKASISKHPLFFCGESSRIADGGNHQTPNGLSTELSPLLGVTHHFKWRKPVWKRMTSRAGSTHAWRHESAAYMAYLEENSLRLPTTGCFSYSREELFRRGLLKKMPLSCLPKTAARRLVKILPGPAQNAARGAYRFLRRTKERKMVPRSDEVSSRHGWPGE
jgi:Glycosyl transferase family 2